MKLRVYCDRRQLTCYDFALIIDSTAGAVSKWMTGGSLPSRATMVRIYQATRGQVMPNDFYDLPKLRGRPPRLPPGGVRKHAPRLRRHPLTAQADASHS